MSTPFVTTFTTIGDAPMAPARKKARHEYFVIGNGPIDTKILFPELDDDTTTPLHMKRFPTIRPRRQTRFYNKKGGDDEYNLYNEPTSSSVPFPFLDDNMIRNPMLQLTMSTMYRHDQESSSVKLRQRSRSNDEKQDDYARSS